MFSWDSPQETVKMKQTSIVTACVCVCFWSPNVQFVRIKLFCKCVSETIVSKIACLQYHVTVYLQVKHINTFCLIALLSGVMDFLFSIWAMHKPSSPPHPSINLPLSLSLSFPQKLGVLNGEELMWTWLQTGSSETGSCPFLTSYLKPEAFNISSAVQNTQIPASVNRRN